MIYQEVILFCAAIIVAFEIGFLIGQRNILTLIRKLKEVKK